MKKRPNSLTTALGLTTVSTLMLVGAGCSSSDAPASSSVKLSGTMNTAASVAAILPRIANPLSTTPGDAQFGMVGLASLSPFAHQEVSFTGLSITCSTFAVPPVSVTGTVGSNGSFSIDLSSVANQPLTCSLVDGNGNGKGTFLISDSSKKDMSGKASVNSTVALNGSAALGTIPYDPNAQEITIPAASMGTSVDTASSSVSVFDPTGFYKISPVTFTLPKGVHGLCADNHADNSCNGPSSTDTVYMRMFKGKAVSDSSPIYALEMWNTPTDYTA